MLPISSGSRRSTGTSRPAASRRLSIPLGPSVDLQPQRRAALVGEARRPQRHREVIAVQVIGAGLLGGVRAPVVQPVQLLLEQRRGEGRAGVELERRRVHLRRQRPAAPLELTRHQAVQVEEVTGDRQRGRGGDEQHEPLQALQMNSSVAGSRRL